MKNRRLKKFLITLGCVAITTGVFFFALYRQLIGEYRRHESVAVTDRNGTLIALLPNQKGNYARYGEGLPSRLAELLVQVEDRFFYWHLGINPVSAFRAAYAYLLSGVPRASSTITQQLVKNLLGNEKNRTMENKLVEMAYAFALEVFSSKQDILTMYGNSVYLGNQVQGLHTAAESYFGKSLGELNDAELLSLVATIPSPSTQNPLKNLNRTALSALGEKLGVMVDARSLSVKKSLKAASDAYFELASLVLCQSSCAVTVDKELSDTVRDILKRNISETARYGGRNGAVVVIKLPENELLAVIGTPDTGGSLAGTAINMALRPRPIGSTVKPFIYLKAFEKGARPYTTVEDREYKFPIGTGYPLYPKNYDGAYRGTVTLHNALVNSLNVPTVKTLEYVGLSDFYSFLERTLGFKPLQPLESYQYGIALGGLEMDPLTLAHLMTIFPNRGELKPLTLSRSSDTSDVHKPLVPPMESGAPLLRRAALPQFTELVTKILSDRLSGVEQFGLAGNLNNLSESNYAVKTGTSRDFHDTWTVGYTPDFLVAVWLGNVENEPMRQLTSSSGAGKIWRDTMELLLNSPYNKKTPLDVGDVVAYTIDGKTEYGLAGDNTGAARGALTETSLIRNPHNGDTFRFEPNMTISLRSSAVAHWYVNGVPQGEGAELPFRPRAAGTYTIRAAGFDREETVVISVVPR